LVLAAGAERTSVAVIGFRAVDVSQQKVDAFADVFADALAASSPGLKVISASAVAGLLGLERQRQLTGCPSDSQCISEIAAALGPKVVVTGAVVKAGSKYLVSVRATASSDAQTLFADQKLVDGEDDVVSWLHEIASPMGQHLAPAESGGHPSRVIPIASSAVGVVGLGAAVAFFVLTDSEHRAFLGAQTLSLAHSHASNGNLDQALAWTGVGLVGAAAVGWVAWLLMPSAPAQVAFVPGSGGGSLVVGGTF